MNSFIYHINRYTTQLDLVLKQGWQFNQEGAAVPKCQRKPLARKEVLSSILSTLKKAPLYYAHGEPLGKFLTVITNYKNTAIAKEKKEVEKVAKKINEFIQQRGKTVLSCFQGEPAKQVNVLLDTKAEQLKEENYLLLRELTTLFAFKRQLAHLFYQRAAISERIKELRETCPQVVIIDEQSSWTASITSPLPENSIDLQFYLFVLFQYQNNTNLAYTDVNLIKEIIRRKVSTQDKNLKAYLIGCLQLPIIASLCMQWDQLQTEEQAVEELDRQFSLPKDTIDPYSCEFIHEPSAYIELMRSKSALRPFGQEGKIYGEIAKDLFTYYHDSDKEFDQWYKAIYEKIVAYQNLHPQAQLPYFSPQKFASIKDFTSPEEINVPLLNQIRQWEREAIAEIEHQKTPPDRPKKVPQPKPKPTISKEIVPSPKPQTPIKEEPSLVSPGLVLSKEKEIEIDKVDLTQDKEEISQVALQTVTAPSIVVPSISKETPLETPKKPLEQCLIETSPFHVKERIIQWFIPNENLPILNKESHFIHNFAWAANDILWQFGLRYPRENEQGICQPAITMLCQAEHSLFPKTELFYVTITFDHVLEQRDTSSHLPIPFNPSWICYHRALTRRSQNMNIVDEYIKNGKNQFIDFPPLPSQRLHIELPSDLSEKKYPDGSFIESNSNSIITVRDPKHDTKIQKCRLHFFVVR